LPPKGLKPVAEIGVLDSGQAAARKEPDGRPAGSGGPGKTVRRSTEVVDQCVVPIAHEFSDHADSRATRVDAVIEALRSGGRGVGPVVVAAGIQMQPAGDRNAVLFVHSADGGPVIRHFHDRIRRRSDRTLDRNGGAGVDNPDFAARPGIGVRHGSGVGRRLLLQHVELLLHHAQLPFQRGNFRVGIAGGLRLRLCRSANSQQHRQFPAGMFELDHGFHLFLKSLPI
jgi:hypothetical protein